LLWSGGPHSSSTDTDIAITAESLDKFETIGEHGPRFSKSPFGQWVLQSERGFRVEIDFLDKTGQIGCLHPCSEYSLLDGIPVATLADLTVGKGWAWVDWEKFKDLYSFRCIVRTMIERGLNFREVGEENQDALEDIISALAYTKEDEDRRLVRAIRTLM